MEKISFIPQKENKKIAYQGQGPGALVVFSIIMFVISLLAFGGTFLYKNFVIKQIATLEDSLDRTKESFDDALIYRLDEVSTKIELGKKLLNEHTYLSGLFVFLGNNTLKNVSLTSFSYQGSGDIILSGVAQNYTSVANQAKAFKNDKNVKSVDIFKLTLVEGGVINFEAKIEFIPSFFSYLLLTNK